jgi:hypothetical protein
MTVTFRNVDATPNDPVATWPFEGLVVVIERGLVADWQPLIAELQRSPWGLSARRVEAYLGYETHSPTTRFFALALARARSAADAEDRANVAARVREAIARSGLTAAAFAAASGTSASRLSTYATGKVVPSAALLLRIERIGTGESPPPPLR